MTIDIDFSSVISGALSSLIGKGFETWRTDDKFSDIKNVVVESLLRELRVAQELIQESEKVTKDDRSVRLALISSIELTSFAAVTKSGFPLSKMFSDEIAPEFWGQFDVNALFSNRVCEINSLNTLLERTYFRLKIYLVRTSCDVDVGDLDYLKFLIRASITALAKKAR